MLLYNRQRNGQSCGSQCSATSVSPPTRAASRSLLKSWPRGWSKRGIRSPVSTVPASTSAEKNMKYRSWTNTAAFASAMCPHWTKKGLRPLHPAFLPALRRRSHRQHRHRCRQQPAVDQPCRQYARLHHCAWRGSQPHQHRRPRFARTDRQQRHSGKPRQEPPRRDLRGRTGTRQLNR